MHRIAQKQHAIKISTKEVQKRAGSPFRVENTSNEEPPTLPNIPTHSHQDSESPQL